MRYYLHPWRIGIWGIWGYKSSFLLRVLSECFYGWTCDKKKIIAFELFRYFGFASVPMLISVYVKLY